MGRVAGGREGEWGGRRAGGRVTWEGVGRETGGQEGEWGEKRAGGRVWGGRQEGE